MSSWTTVFADLTVDPVRGEPDAFRSAAREANRLVRSATTVHTEFARVAGDGRWQELRGETAERLAHLIGEVDGSIADLAPVFDELDDVFRRHAELLDELHRRTTAALARATARWHDARRADSELDAATARLRQLEHDLRATGPADDPIALATVDQLESDRWYQSGRVRACRDRVEAAGAALAASRREYADLQRDERELVELTVRAIDGVDLGDLRDPNRLVQLVSDVVGALASLGEDLLDAVVHGALELVRALEAIALTALTEALRALALELRAVLLALAWLGTGVLEALSRCFPPDHTSGDLDGTYTGRVPDDAAWHVDGGSDRERGLGVLLATLRHTSDEDRIRKDEFEVIAVGEEPDVRYIVVMPGVTDLSRPNIGLDPHTRTVRDVDQHALPSAASTGMDDNLYAAMVSEALRRNGVPPGADVMLVGHSYGADTALDLAADPRFNGPGGYHVTHVLAAAYDSAPQMPSVPQGTEVLVVQNHRDAAVLVEHAGQPVVSGVDRFMSGLDQLIDRDTVGGLGLITSAPFTVAHAHVPIDQTVARTVEVSPTHTQIVFEGGGEGVGHHPNNYIDYLAETGEPRVADFATSVAAAGYAGPGSSVSIDVSVPR